MGHTLIFIVIVLLTSCLGTGDSFEKNYYEKITGIKLPNNYKVLETFDNGEWLTGTVFNIDSLTLNKFVRNNNFDTLQKLSDLHLMSNSYLTKYKPDFKTTKDVYFISKSKGKNNWTYVADLNSNILWAEISYPDWGGE